MTLIKCPCLHCGGTIEFEEDAAGQEAECPHCHKQTWIDLPGKMNYIPPGARNQFRPSTIPLKPPVTKHLKECPDCSQPISQRAIFCPHCGTIPNVFETASKILVIALLVGFCLGIILFFVEGFLGALRPR